MGQKKNGHTNPGIFLCNPTIATVEISVSSSNSYEIYISCLEIILRINNFNGVKWSNDFENPDETLVWKMNGFEKPVETFVSEIKAPVSHFMNMKEKAVLVTNEANLIFAKGNFYRLAIFSAAV